MAFHYKLPNFQTMDGPEPYGTEGPTRPNSPDSNFDIQTMDGPEPYGTGGPTRPNSPESTWGHVCFGPWECEASDCFCRKLVEDMTEEGLVDVLLEGGLSEDSDWTDLEGDLVSLSNSDYGSLGDYAWSSDEDQSPDQVNYVAESFVPHSARHRGGMRTF
ncbi:hypothetical protein EJ03DRAFT_347450 [Teratosphaeria nubilosa]|uniref:Uncharacterized protein n=1 Tax=Teratosphaeria nubilosa TaxID=161662 RepID=A0A6G1LM98_9PEZI|nr:hypothetical protein EJ03DRAFT_347450 [Teratosphaeria nubilosa]